MRWVGAIFRSFRRRLLWWLLLLVFVIVLTVQLLAWREYRGAEAAWKADQGAEALGRIQNCLLVWRWSRPANLLAARIARSLGQYPIAEYHLNEYKRLGGSDEDSQLEWLLMRAQTGELDELANALVHAADSDERNCVHIYTALAQAYMTRHRYAPALGILQRLLEADPDNIRALDWKGWVLHRLNHNEEAIELYSRTLELAPERDAVRKRLAEIYLAANDPVLARPHLEHLLQKTPDAEDLLIDWATMSRLTGDTEEAERTLDKILNKNPDLAGVLTLRAKVALGKNQLEEAEGFLRRAEKLAPEDPEILFTLHSVLRGQNKPEANAYLERHQKKERDLRRLTTLLREKGERLLEEPDAATEAGKLLFREGADKAAVHWLHAALRKDPNYKPAHAELAKYYKRINDTEMATEHLRLADEIPRQRQSP